MIGKILLTLFVIIIAWLVISNRQRRMTAVAAQPRVTHVEAKTSSLWKWGGYIFIILMIIGSGLFLYMEWQDRYRVVAVQVIDSQTGKSTYYQARRMDVDERSFVTLDGREVSVAETERIELNSVRVDALR
ncbi:MAG: antitermination protein NusG [Candidatus Thiodiazotropha sp. (ex Gloverina cf. vestifex)]|nr:antitermination protein NusG [Candidatus Thiodiazotropha sp. (ex Gloverina cf. vestifex)]